MGRPALEVTDIFRTHGRAWRLAQHAHLNLSQLKVMSAIEQCRTTVLGGHVLHCPACDHLEIAYNSCRNRHCPKCQARAAQRWLEERQADLLPVAYYHVVFTLPAPISALAYTNKALIYRLLFEVAAETLRTIAGDARHLGAQIGVTLVLHTWGSALTHHPHVRGIVPCGGLSADGERWVACKPGFFLPVRVLSRLFRRRFLEELSKAHGAGQLRFFGEFAGLADAFVNWLLPLRQCEWVVYAKRPFAGPAAVLAYLSRYTHRVAISNQRLVAMDERGITFRWKDYRAKGRTHLKTMTLSPAEFMRRFLLHVLPSRFHRIRHTDSAYLRLPGLRGGHGHHRNLRAWGTDPRTTVAARGFMNSTRCPILSLEIHRLPPIRHRFACQGERPIFSGRLTRWHGISAPKPACRVVNYTSGLPEHCFVLASRSSNPHSGIAGK